MKKVLEDAGYVVTVGADGAEGEARLREQGYDLLILDMNMPGRDGWDVLGYAAAHHPMMPVMIITGMFDQLDSTVIPGVACLLKKPIEVPPLLKAIERVLDETMEQRLERVAGGLQAESWIRICG